MSYRVERSSRARRGLRRLHPREADRIERAIAILANDPRPAGCKRLTASAEWRIRVGDYRIIYRVDDELSLVFVIQIDKREDAYRRR